MQLLFFCMKRDVALSKLIVMFWGMSTIRVLSIHKSSKISELKLYITSYNVYNKIDEDYGAISYDFNYLVFFRRLE